MGITFGDYLIDSGYHDITPEQEREIEAREECARRGLDPDDYAADGVLVWMVVDHEMRQRRSCTCQLFRDDHQCGCPLDDASDRGQNMSTKRIRFHTPEMGEVGHTRWFEGEEKLPTLDWSKVTAIETSEEMAMAEFKVRFPLIDLPKAPS